MPPRRKQRATKAASGGAGAGSKKRRAEEAAKGSTAAAEAQEDELLELGDNLELQQNDSDSNDDSSSGADEDIPVDEDVDEAMMALAAQDDEHEDDEHDGEGNDDDDDEESDDEELAFAMDDVTATSDEDEHPQQSRATKSKKTTTNNKHNAKNGNTKQKPGKNKARSVAPPHPDNDSAALKNFGDLFSSMVQGKVKPGRKGVQMRDEDGEDDAHAPTQAKQKRRRQRTKASAAAAQTAGADDSDADADDELDERPDMGSDVDDDDDGAVDMEVTTAGGASATSNTATNGDDDEGPSERILEWMGRAPRYEVVDVKEYMEKLKTLQQDSEDEQFGGPAEGSNDEYDADEFKPARRVYDVESRELRSLSDIFSKAPDSEQYLREKQERHERIQQRMRELQSRKPMPVASSDSDTSDDEHSRNTVGNIPMEWYKDYDHLGYDRSGKKISKLGKAKDRLDKFLDKMENGGLGRTVYDPTTGEEIELSDDLIGQIKKIQAGELPGEQYEDYVDFFTSDVQRMPVTGRPEPKSRFIPSKWEHKKIMHLVRGIRKGRLKPLGPPKKEPEFYDLWGQEDDSYRAPGTHIPAPKLALPDHDESYNPPPEYLPTDEQRARWEKTPVADRRKYFMPTKFSSLRLVPAYNMFLRERFERCLDLYLCPRTRKVRQTNVNAQALLPKLPDPKDLQPFPTAHSLSFLGHTDIVTCLSVDPTGQWLFSGSEDGTLRMWEIATGRCAKVLDLKEPVLAVAANPNPQLSLVAVAAKNNLYIVNHGLSSKAITAATQEFAPKCKKTGANKNARITVRWYNGGNGVADDTIVYTIMHRLDVTKLTWHHRGNYLASVMPEGTHDCVAIHSMGKQATQYPFRKKNNDIQDVQFHPKLPVFFVATKTRVRIYNLQTQMLVKKLMTGVKWVSSMAVHPGGDNVIIGSYDRRLAWFDTDLSTKPYKTLRYHRYALRSVKFHRRYPLFASCSDDGSVHVFHGMVYNDLLQNPLIVPVKILKGHERVKGLGVLDIAFHPRQPWVFSAGADGVIKLYT
ncbi:hypothetical protein PTSG_10085 [Salpingoeca rosetta]|uniref:Ribosome biogenesis protein BOP1 homolog n=1 Tax=Salpingoeca rosetta (strain ATCC 50818 / BSB-021) TaxID=946362 RepID=F2UPF9_SALR5|nr:uncharacterized protein PTSG_10085 [Salpingoeca rosetta]EGD79514.1 hypothetical protein PTSG_10085 [Salpingoeca rosetta]|eukprot:XP_004988995.1 hypothetical protein PTSG_10085 [Salpingoeca rosetta]